MIFLWNPTNEDLEYMYAGLSDTLKGVCPEFPKGQRKRVQEAEGNHVLNQFGKRGLTKLVFNEDGQSINEDKIRADALERNREFKIKQVVTYNNRNERRKAAGQAYDIPPLIVKKYAAELGIDLLKPYEMAEGEKGQIGTLTKENQDLREAQAVNDKKIADLTEMVRKLTDAIQGGYVKAVDLDELKEGAFFCTVKDCKKAGEPFKSAQALKQHVHMAHEREGTG